MHPSYKEIDVSLAVALYVQDGLSTHKIAAQLGVSQSKVLSEIRRAGVLRRPKGGHPSNYKEVDEGRLLSLYVEDGKTTHQISKLVGLSQRQVYLRLKKLGVIRTRSEARIGKLRKSYGDRRFTSDGYVALYLPDHPNATQTGWILEHRFVMSGIVKRPLTAQEVVHHKNHNRHDNRPENLQLYHSAGEHSVREHRHVLSDDEMLAQLRALYENTRRPIREGDLRPIGGVCHAQTFRQRFGSWRIACSKAGVPDQ